MSGASMSRTGDTVTSPGPGRLLRRLLPTQYSALAAIQAFMLIGTLAYVLWPPAGQATTAFSTGLIPALALLMTCTELLARRLPWWGLEISLTITWLLIAGLTATRANGQGQLFLAFTIMILTVYALYYLPRRHAVAHVLCMTAVYAIALFIKFGNPGPSLFMVALLAMLAGAALLGAARANDRRERLLIDYASDVVFHSADGVVQWISPSVRDVLGWEPGELIGTSIHRLWHRDDYDKALLIRDAAYSGTAGVSVLRFLHQGGDYRWIEITFKPYSEHGEPGAVGSMRDVSDRVAAEEALMASEEEYRQLAQMEAERREQIANLDEVKSRLFQNISHELRTPLTLIQAPLHELLNDEADLSRMSERRRADLAAAARAASGLQRLVDGLLDVARGQAGELKNSPESTDLAALSREAIGMFRARADQAGLQVIVTAVGFPPWVLIDRDLWLKILTNLVSNAVKFTARGQVSIDLRYARGSVELLVADSGLGISEADLPHIFSRFQQASSRSARGESGSGIGLALVAELVRAAGGDIHVDSAVGVGTTFIVRVPADRCDPPAEAPLAPMGTVREAHSADPRLNGEQTVADPADLDGRQGGRILLVEDHADLRTYVARLLRSHGWTVTTVGTAEEAQALVSQHELLVSDVMLPGAMDGLDLVRWTRETEEVRLTPIIVVTARAGLDSLLAALGAGADAFIAKPFNPDVFVARVVAHMELAALRNAAHDGADGPAEDLRNALVADRVIGTALGILMAGDQCSAAEAFARLGDASRLSQRGLKDVAGDIVVTGSLVARSDAGGASLADSTRGSRQGSLTERSRFER